MNFDLTGFNRATTIAGQGAAGFRATERKRQMDAMKELAKQTESERKYQRGRTDKANDLSESRDYKATLKLAEKADKAKEDVAKATKKHEDSILSLSKLLAGKDVGGDPAIAENMRAQVGDQGDKIVDLSAQIGAKRQGVAKVEKQAKESKAAEKIAAADSRREQSAGEKQRGYWQRRVDKYRPQYNQFMAIMDNPDNPELAKDLTEQDYAYFANVLKPEYENAVSQLELLNKGSKQSTPAKGKKKIKGF